MMADYKMRHENEWITATIQTKEVLEDKMYQTTSQLKRFLVSLNIYTINLFFKS